VNCLICDNVFDDNRALATHIRFTHKMKAQEYYDKYLKQSGEGICKCLQPTTFKSIVQGYCGSCSYLCAEEARGPKISLAKKGVPNYKLRGYTQDPEHVSKRIKCGKEHPFWSLTGKENPSYGKSRCVGKENPNYKDGRSMEARTCSTCVKPISWQGKTGFCTTCLIPYRQECSKGRNNPNWRGGITSEHKLIRSSKEYFEWRGEVFRRDGYSCQHCGSTVSGCLCAHHINCFADFPEQRLVVKNGITWCVDCHEAYHILYGYLHSNEKDFYLFQVEAYERKRVIP
jgi:hypothetical protein